MLNLYSHSAKLAGFMRHSLDIIVVNWNSGRQLYECVVSITAAGHPDCCLNHIVVVDNASTDGSLEGLENIQLPMKILKNNYNIGFAAACNQGARESTADFILFLNPDTVLDEQSLTIPIAFLTRPGNSAFGIVGIQLVNADGMISRSCARFPTPGMIFNKMLGLDKLFPKVAKDYFMTEWDHCENREVDHVMGAFIMVRRALFESLSGFDERFFVYLEDLDFSLRVHRAGWRSYFIADSRAYHKGGGTSEQVKSTRLFYSLRSRILYGFKHFNPRTATGLMLGTLMIEPMIRIAFALARLSLPQIAETAKGYGMLWSAMPAVINSARKRSHAS